MTCSDLQNVGKIENGKCPVEFVAIQTQVLLHALDSCITDICTGCVVSGWCVGTAPSE